MSIRGYARNLMELANQENMVESCYSEIKAINDELNKSANAAYVTTNASGTKVFNAAIVTVSTSSSQGTVYYNNVANSDGITGLNYGLISGSKWLFITTYYIKVWTPPVANLGPNAVPDLSKVYRAV